MKAIKAGGFFYLAGLKSTLRRLEDLPKKAHRTAILRQAVTKGSQILARRMKATAPKRTGTLKRALGWKVRSYRGVVVGIVGVRRGIVGVDKKGRPVNPIKYLHLVEYGTRFARAQPFMRAAWSSSRAQVLATMRAEIARGIWSIWRSGKPR